MAMKTYPLLNEAPRRGDIGKWTCISTLS